MPISERTARRKLDRLGYVLYKSRVRNPADHRFGGYLIALQSSNGVVAGGQPEFGLDLEDVAEFIKKELDENG